MHGLKVLGVGLNACRCVCKRCRPCMMWLDTCHAGMEQLAQCLQPVIQDILGH